MMTILLAEPIALILVEMFQAGSAIINIVKFGFMLKPLDYLYQIIPPWESAIQDHF